MNFKDIDQLLIKKLPVNESKKTLLKRRLNKLKRDPKGFLEGSYKKRSAQAKAKLPIKYSGENKFVIISPIYNVEKYLDDYFKSIVNQSLSFKNHIHILCVDDGSTDSSAKIIKKWQKKFPKNITYLYKDNGGLSSARNFGLSYLFNNSVIECNYLTFTDPDDFLSLNYFRDVDIFFCKHKKCEIVSCNMKYFFEENGLIKDIHPLKFRYNKSQVFDSIKMGKYVLLSAATTVYSASLLHSLEIKFDEMVKPSFEDCKFNNQILSLAPEIQVGFIRESIYFYRQRADASSLMNTSWKNKALFLNALEYGVLDLLVTTKDNMGYVPIHIQNVALFHCVGYYRRLINAENHADILNITEKERFTELLKEIFSYIDSDTIISYSFSNMQNKIKAGLLGYYKNEKHPINYFYINRINTYQNTINLSFFTHFLDDCVEFKLNEKEVFPIERKIISSKFLQNEFFYELRFLLTYKTEEDVLSIKVNGKLVNLSCFTKSVTGGDEVSRLIDNMKDLDVFMNMKKSWVIMDRVNKADDNAEHFYRFLKRNYPQYEIYFAIDKFSRDWVRLSEEGFNLLDYGSSRFTQELKSCTYIVSSHLFIWNFFIGKSRQALSQKKNIWLQHGVIANNNAAVINTKSLDLMVTSTCDEYHSIANNYTEYNLLDSQVLLSGLPRHDSLLVSSKIQPEEKLIFIMPTWRTWLKDENIIESVYFNAWYDFLSANKTEALLSTYGYRLVFVMHEELKQFTGFLPKKHYVTYENLDEKSLQELFITAKLMITDYSSVSFDMAYLKKPVIYYQFDSSRFFNEHYKQGYFSYKDDGFGPVVTNESKLISELEKMLENDCKSFEPFKSRLENTFPFRDGGNCERIYQAIVALDQPNDSEVDIDVLYEFTAQAYQHQVWDLVEQRSQLLIENSEDKQQQWAQEVLIEALFRQNKFTELFNRIEALDSLSIDTSYWFARTAFVTANWNKAINALEALPRVDEEMLWMLLVSYAETANLKSYRVIKERFGIAELSLAQSIMIEARYLQAGKQWELLIEFLESKLTSFDAQELRDYQPQILIGQAYRCVEEFDKSHDYLVIFEGHTTDSTRCAIEIAQLAFERHNFSKCITQYVRAVSNNLTLLAEAYAVQYAQALDIVGEPVNVVHQLTELSDIHSDNQVIQVLLITALARCGKWHEVIETAIKYELLTNEDTIYPLTLARYRLGKLEEAYKNLLKPINTSSYDYWSLVAELAFLMEDFELAKFCYKMMIALYPHEDTKGNWTKLNYLRAYS